MPQTGPTFTMIAKTLSGLEGVLADELRSLGATAVTEINRAVQFEGDQALLYKANLHSRLAGRVLMPIHAFTARDRDHLYRGVGKVDWLQYLDPDMTIAVDVVLANSPFDNSMYVAQRTKDAIVDQLRTKSGRRPDVDSKNPDLRINIHIVGDKASLALDSSGDPLNQRGYRLASGEAPINEVLAAGIIALSGWDASVPLVDPMCGSGTFAIEAAMLARNIAPGLIRRRFGFMRWKNYSPELLERLKMQAREQERPAVGVEIVAADIDKIQAAQTKQNAAKARVGSDLTIRRSPFKDLVPPDGPGVLITNPPYDERIRTVNITGLYKEIGDTLKQRYRDYTAYIFTANAQAAKSIGLRTARRVTLYNGPLEGRLLKFELYSGSRKHREDDPDRPSRGNGDPSDES